MILTVKEVAALLRVKEQTVRNWAHAKMYGARRVGYHFRFHIHHLPLDPIAREEYKEARRKVGKP